MKNVKKVTEEKGVKNEYYNSEDCRTEERKLKPENLNGIYKDFAEHFGIEITERIYKGYKGLQVTFPVKFLSSEYIAESIIQEYNGSNIRELARKYECSERKVRGILSEHFRNMQSDNLSNGNE